MSNKGKAAPKGEGQKEQPKKDQPKKEAQPKKEQPKKEAQPKTDAQPKKDAAQNKGANQKKAAQPKKDAAQNKGANQKKAAQPKKNNQTTKKTDPKKKTEPKTQGTEGTPSENKAKSATSPKGGVKKREVRGKGRKGKRFTVKKGAAATQEGGAKPETPAAEGAETGQKKNEKKRRFRKGNPGALTGARAAKLKALNVQKAITKGTFSQQRRKVRYAVHFKRPFTLRTKRAPKYPRMSVPRKSQLHQYNILLHPLATETAMKKIEQHNTIVFMADLNANKNQIKSAAKKMYDMKVAKVNTLITPLGQKKAFIKLDKDQDALDIASKIGII